MRIVRSEDRIDELIAKQEAAIRAGETSRSRAQDTLAWLRQRRVYRGIRHIPYLTPEEIKSAGIR